MRNVRTPQSPFAELSCLSEEHINAQKVKILVVFLSHLDTCTKTGVANGKYLAENSKLIGMFIDSIEVQLHVESVLIWDPCY